MVSIKERTWTKPIFQGQAEHKVLNCLIEEKVVTLERLMERFAWIRWGDLFSILGKLRREGLISVHQVGSLLEIRIKVQT